MSTYVITDIHGWWEKFESFLSDFGPEDTVYILGDVIDRGKCGTKILRYIMNNRKQFKMILGNHECMMLDYLNSQEKEYASYADYLFANAKYFLWVVKNQGDITLQAYNLLSVEEKAKIKEFLTSLPVAYQNVKVGDNTFYLIHASANEKVGKRTMFKNRLEQKDLKSKELFGCIWNRECYPESYHAFDDRIVVAGHTIVNRLNDKMEVLFSKDDAGNLRYINIDCGCALESETSKLACLCLDDLSVKYY